jgi:type IV secretory pathway VirB6-like protein
MSNSNQELLEKIKMNAIRLHSHWQQISNDETQSKYIKYEEFKTPSFEGYVIKASSLRSSPLKVKFYNETTNKSLIYKLIDNKKNNTLTQEILDDIETLFTNL